LCNHPIFVFVKNERFVVKSSQFDVKIHNGSYAGSFKGIALINQHTFKI